MSILASYKPNTMKILYNNIRYRTIRSLFFQQGISLSIQTFNYNSFISITHKNIISIQN